MATMTWTLIVAAALLGCLATVRLGRSLGRKFFSRACLGAGIAIAVLGLSGLLLGPFGGPVEALWLAATYFFLAAAITAAVRLVRPA